MTKKQDFFPRTIVTHKSTGRRGVVVNDLPGILACNGPEEVSVVYEGVINGEGTDWRDLQIIGKEKAEADLKKCGAGQGERACIYLAVGAKETLCLRFGSEHWNMMFRPMAAKRHPVEAFPLCQLSIEE